MAVPTITLFANSPNTTPYPCSIGSNSPYDFDINPRSSSQKPMIGGLSYLFSSPASKHASSSCCTGLIDDLRHDKKEDLASSYCYSPYLNSFTKRDSSPVSVFQGPVSASSSPLSKFARDSGEGRIKRSFNGLVGHNVSVDYELRRIEMCRNADEVDELTFNLEESFVEDHCVAKDLLVNAQSRHSVFCDDVVVKAFHEAEKAHRGQV